MSPTTIDLITISRQFGAGGGELARALAAQLGWPVLDRDVVHRVAERLAIDETTAERLDEHVPSRLSRIAAALLVLPPEAPVRIETERILDADKVAAAARAVILEAAQTTPVIIVGHGGQCLFRARPGTLHIRVVAPMEQRLRRVARRLGSGARVTPSDLERMDAERREYLRRHMHCDWEDAMLYDIQINTGRVTADAAASAIAKLASLDHTEVSATP